MGGPTLAAWAWLLAQSAAATVLPADHAAIPAAPCDLHVWPAAPLQVLSEGWVANRAVDHDLPDIRALAPARAAPLATPRQVEVLRGTDFSLLLNRPGATVVVHDAPAERRQPGAPRLPREESGGACHAELVLAKLFFTKTPMSEGALRATFVLEDFAGPGPAAFAYTGLVEAPLSLFPPQDASEAAAADRELAGAFAADIRQFAVQVSVRYAARR